MEDIITIKDLKFSYGKKVILKKINLSIKRGEIIGLIGENGAGKSTVLKILLGVLGSHNNIRILGEFPGSINNKEKIGSMFQGDMRIKNVNVQEILEFVASQYDNPLSVEQVIKTIGLVDIKRQLLTKLSGGQMRRVTLGMALINNPELLFLDEPTSGMDVNSRQEFREKVEDLKKLGKTVVITSHYLDEIQQTADRILILQNGVFSFQGTLAELQAQHHETKIIFKTNLPPSIFVALPEVKEVEKHGDQIELISINGDLTIRDLVLKFKQIEDIQVQRQSLEEIFMKMTSKEQG